MQRKYFQAIFKGNSVCVGLVREDYDGRNNRYFLRAKGFLGVPKWFPLFIGKGVDMDNYQEIPIFDSIRNITRERLCRIFPFGLDDFEVVIEAKENLEALRKIQSQEAIIDFLYNAFNDLKNKVENLSTEDSIREYIKNTFDFVDKELKPQAMGAMQQRLNDLAHKRRY